MRHPPIKSQFCRVCHGHELRQKSGFKYSWFQCTQCLTVNRDISENEFLSLNPTYDPEECAEGLTTDEFRTLLDVDTKKRFLTTNLGDLTARPNLRFLDIGCGIGGYLIAGQELGFSCVGVEPSLSHSAIGREQFGLNIKNVYFDETILKEETFDIILLSHVLEHIFNPKHFLELAFEKLKPGGVILIVTPNIESLSAKFAGKYWSMYKPVDHVTLIGPTAIPFICPPNTQYSYLTSEYLGEFLVSILISLRDRYKESFFYKTNRQLKQQDNGAGVINLNPSFRKRVAWILITAVNIPFFLITKLLNKQSCLSVRINREQ